MADDQSLNVTISASDAGATATTSEVNSLLAAMEAELAKLNATGTATLEALTVGHRTAAAAATEHAAAESIFGESIGKVETATNSAARVFGALGLNAAEATERVEGFGEALEGLSKAALPLLAVGAAVLAVAEAFNFLKEGIDEAGKAQVTMAALGQAVKDQGGAWDDAAKDGIEKFLDTIERATTYSRGEVLPALESLVAAGMSVAGAEKVIAVSTDVAAASHRNLTEVVQLLRSAELGRARGLEELDPKLKALIASHADFNAVLNQLAHDMSGQASAAAETFEGRQKQLGNELAHVGEELGEHLLPMLTTGTEILIGFAESAEKHEPQVVHFFDTLIDDAKKAYAVLSDLATMAQFALDAASGNVSAMMQHAAGNHKAATDLLGGFKTVSSTDPNNLFALQYQPGALGGSGGSPVGDWMRQMSARAAAEEAAAKKDFAGYERTTLSGSDDPTMGAGKPKTGYEAGSYDFTDVALPTFDKDPDGAKQKALDDALKSNADNERTFADAVKGATTVQAEQNAQWELVEAKTRDAQIAVSLLTAAIAQQTHEVDALKTALPGQEQAAVDATKAYNAYGDALKAASAAGEKPNKDQENHLKDLKTAMDAATKAAKDHAEEINKLNGYLEANKEKLAAATEATHAYADALAEASRKEQEFTDKSIQNLSDSLGKSIQEHQAKVQQLSDEEALYGLSLAQQLAFYERRYALEVQAYGEDSELAKADFDKLLSIEKDEYTQRLDAQKKYVEDVEASETTLLNDLIEKHQSFHTVLHDIFQQIGDDFIKMVERMLVEQPLLVSMEKTVAGLFGGAGGTGGGLFGGGPGGLGGGATGAANATSIFGAAGMLFGETGASNVTSQLDTTSVTSTFLGTSAASQIATNTQNATSSGDSGPAFGSVDAMGNPVVGTSSSSPNYFANAIGGAGIGATIGSITGGNEANAAVGGALGSSLGTLIGTLGGATGGPLGSLIGTVLGSVVGSLFGSHANPGQNPDEFEGQTGYGQDVANLQGGQSGASGVAYFPTAQIEQFIEAMGVANGSINGAPGAGQQAVNSNGTIASSGGVDAAEIWLAQNQKDTAQQLEAMGVSPAQFANWEQLFGVSATGSGQYSHIPGDNNIGDIEVTGATSGGNTKTTYTALASALQQIISAGGGNGSTPVFSMTEAYPGAPAVLSSNPLGSINTQTGVYTPNTSVTTAPGSSAGSNVAGTGGSASDATARVGVGNVTITFTGNIVGADGVQTVANEIAQALLNQQSGQVPGAPGNTRAARYGLA